MEVFSENTSAEDQQLAKSSLNGLERIYTVIEANSINTVEIKLQNKQAFNIPKKAFRLLHEILVRMSEGHSLTLLPSDAEISTQQAAEILNISRPYVVSLLEKGEIPFRKVGSHRRVSLKSILEFDEKQKMNRKTQLDFLAEEAQDLNLGY